jgi:hypothetical protein
MPPVRDARQKIQRYIERTMHFKPEPFHEFRRQVLPAVPVVPTKGVPPAADPGNDRLEPSASQTEETLDAFLLASSKNESIPSNLLDDQNQSVEPLGDWAGMREEPAWLNLEWFGGQDKEEGSPALVARHTLKRLSPPPPDHATPPSEDSWREFVPPAPLMFRAREQSQQVPLPVR